MDMTLLLQPQVWTARYDCDCNYKCKEMDMTLLLQPQVWTDGHYLLLQQQVWTDGHDFVIATTDVDRWI